MIGLGSNRLTVCRRGGMSVTQAGRGGMEWLAGGRMPSWASPYSAQATAYLQQHYANMWIDIRNYGFEHPEVVPYINANPDCWVIWIGYVQDGLVFQMDCNYECTAAKWKDVRSAIEFIGTNVQLTDGVPFFNGSAYYDSNDSTGHSLSDCTFEMVFKADVINEAGMIFCDGRTDYSSIVEFSLRASTNHIIPTSGSGTGSTYNHYMFQFTKNTNFNTCSFIVDDNIYINKTKYNADKSSAKNGWYLNTTPVTKKIGRDGRPEGTSFFKGKIYAIRIYNRLLTEQEILANQAIDLQRWPAS